jgi:hypothetical protein
MHQCACPVELRDSEHARGRGSRWLGRYLCMARCRTYRGEYVFSEIRRVHAEGECELRSMSGTPCGQIPIVCRGDLLTNRES